MDVTPTHRNKGFAHNDSDWEPGVITPELFERFRAIAYDQAGISLKSGKESLVAARVAKRQRALGIGSAADYLSFLENDEDGEELIHFLDAISTNFTSFYREPDHFELLEKYLIEWTNKGQRKFRIWCAASSSGEEPYTIALTIKKALPQGKYDIKILATDISTKILQQAREGVYEASQLKAVKRDMLYKYFNKVVGKSKTEKYFEASDSLKDMIIFKRLNLAHPPFPMNGPLDVVFCRNVMIYFDKPVRTGLVSEIERMLKPGGVLMIGHTETLTGLNTGLKIIKPSVCIKPEK